MTFVDTLQLEMPDSFPATPFRAFFQAANGALTAPKGAAWGEFAGASNLIGWRFRACSEYMRCFINSWDQKGSHVEFETVYQREKWLFGMYSAGVSCIESACYAAHALASGPTVLGVTFGPREQRGNSPSALRAAVADYPSALPLVQALDLLTQDPEWAEWRDMRNRMNHRSNLPRIIKGSAGSAPTPKVEALEVAGTTSTEPVTRTSAELEEMVVRLGGHLSRILDGGRQMVV